MPLRSPAGSSPRRYSSVSAPITPWVQVDGRRRGLRKRLDVESAEHRQVVVARQAQRAALADQLGAGVGLGAVADDVPEAPDLLDLRVGDRVEAALERGQVGMYVGDHRDAHGGQGTRPLPWLIR